MRGTSKIFLVLSLALLLTMPFASANIFTDFFNNLQGKISGEVAADPIAYNPPVRADYCTETTDGINGYKNNVYYSNKDYCYGDDDVIQYFCDEMGYPNQYEYECVNGCEDGICLSAPAVQYTCTDTDEENDIFVKGNVYGDRYDSGDVHLDYCYPDEDSMLIQYFCIENGYVNSDEVECKNGCFDGVCLPEQSEEDSEKLSCDGLGGVLVHPDVCGGNEFESIDIQVGVSCCEYNTCGDGICQEGEDICVSDCSKKNLIANGFKIVKGEDNEDSDFSVSVLLDYSEIGLSENDNYWTGFYYSWDGGKTFERQSHSSRSAIESNGWGVELASDFEEAGISEVIVAADMDSLTGSDVERYPSIKNDFIRELNEEDNCIQQRFKVLNIDLPADQRDLVAVGEVVSCEEGEEGEEGEEEKYTQCEKISEDELSSDYRCREGDSLLDFIKITEIVNEEENFYAEIESIQKEWGGMRDLNNPFSLRMSNEDIVFYENSYHSDSIRLKIIKSDLEYDGNCESLGNKEFICEEDQLLDGRYVIQRIIGDFVFIEKVGGDEMFDIITVMTEGIGTGFDIEDRDYRIRIYRLDEDKEHFQDEIKISAGFSDENDEFNSVSCDNGCILEDKCLSYGYRDSGEYCSVENDLFINQKSGELICDNNFECVSNLCIDSKCVSASTWQKIMNWFSRVF